MRLEVGSVHVDEVHVDGRTALDGHALTIDADEVRALVLEDPHFSDARVRVVRPGESVRIYRSATGTGAGPCLPQLGGLCLDLLPPLRVLGDAVANAGGVATVTLSIPPAMPVGTPFHTQAVVRRGAGGADSVKSNTSSAVVQ